MRNQLMMVLSFFALLPASYAFDHCAKYRDRSDYFQALQTVATALQYTREDLCALSRLSDIYVQATTLDNELYESIEHTWVTLHYENYSCQYFVRVEDQVITRKNCYDTW